MKSIPVLCLLISLLVACNRHISKPETRGEAAAAMDMASVARTFPEGKFPNAQFEAAFAEQQMILAKENDPLSISGISAIADWKELGPKNIGGRTLCLAFHPTNPNILWAGSASGGLWKTTTAGVGVQAWMRVKTGFPILGVAAIAVSPDAQTLYIGTGEVYGYQNVGTGYAVRTQRGSYGIGILKSTDGGVTWTKSFNWTSADLRGVQDIVLNPLNPNTVFAATTEGVYRSFDAGKNWILINPMKMAVDLAFPNGDSTRLYATFGSLYNSENGIYRTNNSGTTWTKLTNGLPDAYSGKTRIGISPSEANTLYASVADAFTQRGFYRSTNGGDTWTQLNREDVAIYQGWFSHDVAVHPTNPNIVFHVGVWAYKSTDGGANFNRTGNINTGFYGKVPIGGPEGASDYIHADMHAVYFHPLEPNKVFIATDGGIFVSPNTGITYEGRNGGYQTTQFYANFSSGQRDSMLAVGGLQDNYSALYDGTAAWLRILDGDGMCTAINPQNDSILFASMQYLLVAKSTDKGKSFRFAQRLNDTSLTTFNAPFDIAPSDTTVLYAGGDRLFKSTDAGRSFVSDGFALVDNGNPINTLAIASKNANLLYYATFPAVQPMAKLWKSSNGGISQTQMMGLPNRVFTDILFHPTDSNKVFVTLGGSGSEHLYRTTNGGATWQALGTGLPDIPTNTLVIDSVYPQMMYIGNDLGVYFSNNAGATWQAFSPQSMPEACLVMHLSLSPSNRKLRAATHGNGAYEIDLVKPTDRLEIATIEARLETTDTPIQTNFYLKKTSAVDTSARTFNRIRGSLAIPNDIMPSSQTPPQYPYPHTQASAFSAENYPIQLMADKNDELLAGLSTFDIALISRHVLGFEAITAPFKLVAADVNQDSSIDALDMLLLRRVILRRDLMFRDVPHWVFMPKTFDLPSPPPTLAYLPQAYYFNPFVFSNPNPFQFTAIKIGDIDNSYAPPALSNRSQPKQLIESLVLRTENLFLEKGKTYDVVLRTAKAAKFLALQGSLKMSNSQLPISNDEVGSYSPGHSTVNIGQSILKDTEGVQFIDFQSDVLTNFGLENFNLIGKSQIHFSWHTETAQSFEKGSPIFQFKIKSERAGFLSAFLKFDENGLENAAYTEGGQMGKMNLEFSKQSAGFLDRDPFGQIFQNQPNPFSDKTSIRFVAKEAGVFAYSIFDETGRLLFNAKQNYAVGIGQLDIVAKECGMARAGLYLLQIETAQGQHLIKLQKQ